MFYLQDFHLGQVPEGPISQFADAVSLQFEDLQAGQTLEGQTLHLTNTVPVQLTAEWTDRQFKENVVADSGGGKLVSHLIIL